jgi:Trm5-related predicted tRNA methylase
MSKRAVKRWSAKRKEEVVLRLLRGESLEGGLAALKRRSDDPKVAALEQELRRAKRLVGDLMMDKELLEMRIARHEGELPFPKRRSNP